ncbi:MAG: hypothetical protein J0L75_15820 [Spirochaetes bacterium]|nr:hypothetical protein [Spirochaetota bacterium]
MRRSILILLTLSAALGAAPALDTVPPKQVVNETLNYAHGKNAKGIAAYNAAQYEEALDQFAKAEESYALVDHQIGLIAVLQNKGLVYFALHQDAKAMGFFEEAFTRSDLLSLPKGRADSCQKLGLIALDRGQFAEAKKRFTEAMGLYEKLKDDENIAASMNALGLTLLREENPALLDEAEKRFLDAAKINRGKKQWKGVSVNEANLSEVAFRRKAYPAALDHALSALHVEKQVEDSKGIGSTLGRLAVIYEAMGEKDRAFLARQRAYEANLALGLRDRQQTDLRELLRLGALTGRKARLEEYGKSLEAVSNELNRQRNREERERAKDEKDGKGADATPVHGSPRVGG